MAKYRYYAANGNISDFHDVESGDIEITSDNGVVLVMITKSDSDDATMAGNDGLRNDGLRAIINLAPGERIERIKP